MDDVYFNKIKEIQRVHKHILYLIVTYEIIAEKYPFPILIELRNVFTHLSRSWTHFESDNKVKCLDELDRAEKHCQRAFLDGYKFCCVAISDYYKKIKEQVLDHVHDWTLVNAASQRNLFSEIPSLELCAKEIATIAKHRETEGADEQAHKLWDEAFCKYSELYKCLSDNMAHFEYAKGKANEMQSKLAETQGQLAETQGQLAETQGQLTETQGQLAETQGQLTETQGQLAETQGQLTEIQRKSKIVNIVSIIIGVVGLIIGVVSLIF